MLNALFAQKAASNQELFEKLLGLDAGEHAELLVMAARTLNHIYVVDRIFQAHLEGQDHGYTATQTPSLPDLSELGFEVAQCDAWFQKYVGSVKEKTLRECIDFVFTDGDAARMSRHEMLVHVLTHGTYHRGQVGQMLKGAGLSPPRDLLTRFLHQAEPQRRLPRPAHPYQQSQMALLVIDVQQGLCEGPGAAWNCEALIANLNALSQGARDAQCPVIWVQHQDSFLVPQTPPWQLPVALDVAPDDKHVFKTTPDAFLRTELHAMLAQMNIQHLVVAGMHTEYCVDTTVRRALALGFDVTLVCDAHTSAGHPQATAQQVIAHHNHVLSHITSFGPRATLRSTKEVLWTA